MQKALQQLPFLWGVQQSWRPADKFAIESDAATIQHYLQQNSSNANREEWNDWEMWVYSKEKGSDFGYSIRKAEPLSKPTTRSECWGERIRKTINPLATVESIVFSYHPTPQKDPGVRKLFLIFAHPEIESLIDKAIQKFKIG